MSFSSFNTSEPQGTILQNCSPGTPIGGIDSGNIFRLLKLNTNGTIAMTAPAPITNINAAQNIGPVALPGGPYAANTCLGFFPNIFENTTGNVLEITINPILLGNFTAGNLLNMVFMSSGTNLSAYSAGRTIGSDTFAPTVTESLGLLKFYHNYVFQPFGAAGAGQALPTAAQPSLGTIILDDQAVLQCMVVAGGAVLNNFNAFFIQFSQFSY